MLPALTYSGGGLLPFREQYLYRLDGDQLRHGAISPGGAKHQRVTINGAGVAQLGSSTGLGATSPTITFGVGAPQLQLNGYNLTLGNIVSPTSASNSTAIVGAPVIENGNASTTGTLTLGATGFTYPGSIQDGVGSAALSLVKAGSGTLILTGSNTYSGGTTVTGGILQLGDNNVNNGSINGNVLLNASGAVLAFENPANQTFAGVISGAGGIVKYSTGTEYLTGTNTFTGVLQIEGGTINASTTGINGGGATSGIIFNTAAFSGGTVMYPSTLQATAGGGGINTADSVTMTGNGDFDTNGTNSMLSGIITGAGTLTKLGNGTLTLSGSAINFTGGLAITTGTVQDASSYALQGVLLNLSNANSLTFSSGIGTFYAGSLSGVGNESLLDSASSPINLILSGHGTQTYSGSLSGAGASLTINGGTLTLAGANTYTGVTTLGSGTLNLSYLLNTASELGTGALVMDGETLNLIGNASAAVTQTVNGLTLNPGGINAINLQTYGQNLTLALGAITRNPGSTITFSPPTRGLRPKWPRSPRPRAIPTGFCPTPPTTATGRRSTVEQSGVTPAVI